MKNILWLGEAECQAVERVGGKAANLSRLAERFPVPGGFCLVAQAGRELKPELALAVTAAYHQLGELVGRTDPPVAVRSSAVDEDGQTASFAGQHESYLNISGAEAVLDAVARCLESAYSERALHYRRLHGLAPAPRLAVLVQHLVLADSAVVVFSADPRSGQADRVVINAAWGLGESLVGGSVTPDLYVVQKRSLEVLASQVAEKAVMTVACSGGTREVPVPRGLRSEPVLYPAQLTALARLALKLEAEMGWPVDVEAAFQGGKLYLLQCRPITTVKAWSVERRAESDVEVR
jgi:pyruvate,water dikinase